MGNGATVSVALRRSLLTLHRWTGLTLGLVVMLSALTGAAMAFRNQLDPLFYAGQFTAARCAQPIALDAIAGRGVQAHPGVALDYVRMRAHLPVIVRFVDKQSVFVDPCDGSVTAVQNRYAGVFGTLEYIHRGQWLPGGGLLMGSGALAMILGLAGLGLWLWWPRKPRRIGQALRIERRLKGPAFTLGLHRTVGAWGALVLLASALTGIPNAFEGIKSALIGKMPVLARATTEPLHPPTLESEWATAQRLMPAPDDALIHIARKDPRDATEIFVIEHGAPHPNARSYLYLDAADGHMLRYAPYAASSLGYRMYFWSLSCHTGDALGVPGELLLFFGAASALLLGYTGIGTWVRRKLRQRQPKPAGQYRAA